MPPANTVKVRAACMQKFRSVCLPLRLIRMALEKHRGHVSTPPLGRAGTGRKTSGRETHPEDQLKGNADGARRIHPQCVHLVLSPPGTRGLEGL